MPYKYDVLLSKKIDLGDAYEIEQSVINKFKKNFHYYPQKEFGGRTECFRFNGMDKIKKYLIKKKELNKSQ